MTLPRPEYLLYLGNCHAYGWSPSERGLEAFLLQRDAGWRNKKTGQMIWPGEKKESDEMKNPGSNGVVVVDVSEYHRLVEDGILEKIRADNLQKRNYTLIDEADSLRKELDDVKEKLSETASQLTISDGSVTHWYNLYAEVKKELESVKEAMWQEEHCVEPDDPQEDNPVQT